MIVKLFVLLLCITLVWGYGRGYCLICRNHTLCKYPVVGPSTQCKDFDKHASLSEQHIVEIIDRINARRNLVATGRLNKFPQAANMRIVRWSKQLASIAQRWADQCDSTVRPNKEDECRDLVGMRVGQNIAAVLGPTPGLNVKSFVDMWFMLQLYYTGSVMYYNQTRDEKTNYLSQLIWADTEYVGCGKIKFFNKAVNTEVERLICNFAPKGNNQGKPVYALGYPATQCPKYMKPDREYTGLCKHGHRTEIVEGSSMSSLLRILDSSNNSAKQELGLNHLKQIKFNSTETKNQRDPKTRIVYLNKTCGEKCLQKTEALNSSHGIKRDSFHMQNPLIHNPLNNPDNYKVDTFTPERGHSRMYHGHQTKKQPISNFQSPQPFTEQDFRRYDLTTTTYSFPMHEHEHLPIHDHEHNSRRIFGSNQNDNDPGGRRNFVKNQHSHHCTRKTKNCCTTHCSTCVTNQCTRGQSQSCNSCLQAQPCSSCLQPPSAPPIHDPCGCNTQSPCYTEPSPCDYNMQCPICSSHNCPMSPSGSLCARRRAEDDVIGPSKTTQFNNYYDLFPNIGMRSGDDSFSGRKKIDSADEDDVAQESEISNQVKDVAEKSQTSNRQLQDSYGVFYSSERKRRDFEDQLTFKPFWQMDEYNFKKPSELKSLRYTTLGNKRNRKTRRSTKLPTESITIPLEDEIIHDDYEQSHITEKYLSFEELMHLRKLSTLQDSDYEARRIGDQILRQKPAANTAKTTKKGATTIKKATTTAKKAATTTKKAATITTKKAAATTTIKKVMTTKAATTSKAATTTKAPVALKETTESTTITANTPFKRLKQCTRKLTCTWTAYMMTRQDGIPILPDDGGMIEVGSRTPPGYVEGCTRTSTCTRDFMDRNKMAVTNEDDSTIGEEETTTEDEEYCEKRALNVRRRNLDDTNKKISVEFQETLTEMMPSTPAISHITNRAVINTDISVYQPKDCISYEDHSRVKRGEIGKYEQLLGKDCNIITDNKNLRDQDTYDDLYSIIKKYSKVSKPTKDAHHCPCSDTKSIHDIYFLVFLLKYCITYAFLNNYKNCPT